MYSRENLEKIIDVMSAAYKAHHAHQDIDKWLRYGSHYIGLLNKYLKNSSSSVGEKKRIQLVIIRLTTLIEEFRKKSKTFHHGAGMSTKNSDHHDHDNDEPELCDRVKWNDLQNIFKSNIITGSITNLYHIRIEDFLKDAKSVVVLKIKKFLKKGINLKINSCLHCEYEVLKDDQEVREIKSFITKNAIIHPTTNLDTWFDEYFFEPLLKKIEEFDLGISGWSLKKIDSIIFTICKYQPLRGGISTFIEMPDDIKKKKCCVNIQNRDEFCFLWSITAALHPANDHVTRVCSYPHFSTVLSYDGISFPIKLRDISKFEKLNKLKINVYAIVSNDPKKSVIAPIYLSDSVSDRETIHLLAVDTSEKDNSQRKKINVTNNNNIIDEYFSADDDDDDDDDEDNTNVIDEDGNGYGNYVQKQKQKIFHFALIKNLSRLVSSQVNKKNGRLYICDRCLNHFTSPIFLDRHWTDCCQINHARMIMPTDDKKILKFKNHKHKELVPFVIYADLECILKKNDDTECEDHIPHSAAYYVKCSFNDTLSYYRMNRGENCIEWFIKELENLARQVNEIILNIVPMMKLSLQQEQEFENATICHICEETFVEKDIKHRDHCHFTGKYRGPSHARCNINYTKAHIIPVVMHNLSGYDSHFLIQGLCKLFEGPIHILPINKDKYISFTKKVDKTVVSLRFIDSFRFMPSSIDRLSSDLSNDQKIITRSECNSVYFELLCRKGVFPYEYIDSWEKLEEKNLPPKELFFSKLNNASISDNDYEHAKNIWEKFQINTLGEYSDLYLKTDVLLLADIFENFRISCLSTYSLDTLHYFTAPGLAFDAMLKYTGVKLELLTDPAMHLFIEKGIRGGVAQCMNRYAKANNRYMGDKFDASEEESYIMYFDVNNLYGAGMSQYLPYAGFEWDNNLDIDVNKISNESEIGYILEVDLEYPRNLHEYHKDLPLCPEHFIAPGSKQSKLMTTLFSKKNYVIHYRNLKLYMEFGMKLKKIHRVLKFKQSTWLKKYIDLNTSMRQRATTDFGKNFFKLMNNSVYGKTMQNVRKEKDVKLVTKWEGRFGARSLIAKPNFHSCSIYKDDIAIIEMSRVKIIFNKPIYSGFTILDLSKLWIYDFYYNYIKKNFNCNEVKALYMDTDSLILWFKVPDIYEKMKHNLERFDTSDYPVNNVYNIPQVNKKVIGLMKDENNGKIMTEFAGLRAKLYSYKVMNDDDNDKIFKKAKGVKGSVLKDIKFDNYMSCLLHHQILKKDQYLIRSKDHQVRTIVQKKIALSWADDKRMLDPDGSTDTLPWGYNPE